MTHTVEEAHQTFAEFIASNRARCGGKAEIKLTGTHEVTMLTCVTCNATVEANIPAKVYFAFLKALGFPHGAFDQSASMQPAGQKCH